MNNAIRTVDGMIILEPSLEEVKDEAQVNKTNIMVDNGTITVAQSSDTTNTTILSAGIETKQFVKSDISKTHEAIESLLGLNKDVATKVLDRFVKDKIIPKYNFVVPGDFVRASDLMTLHVILDSNDEIRSVELV